MAGLTCHCAVSVVATRPSGTPYCVACGGGVRPPAPPKVERPYGYGGGV